MEVINVRCLKCLEITPVLKELLVPYEGKIVSLKCSNPQCGSPIRVQVPKLNLTHSPQHGVEEDIVPPTQIMGNKPKQAFSARLRVLRNDKTEEQLFSLKEGVNTIGRLSSGKMDVMPDIPIFTSDRKITRYYHCAITLCRQEDSFDVILRDNKSTNGTFLDSSEKALGQEDEIFLANRDIFIIGDTRIRIELE